MLSAQRQVYILSRAAKRNSGIDQERKSPMKMHFLTKKVLSGNLFEISTCFCSKDNEI